MSVNNVVHSSSKARNSPNVHQLANGKTKWVYAYNTTRIKEETFKDTRVNEGQGGGSVSRALHKRKGLSLDSQHPGESGRSSMCLSQRWANGGKRIPGAKGLLTHQSSQMMGSPFCGRPCLKNDGRERLST